MMDPYTIVLVATTYAASMVLHKCADKALDSAYDKVWGLLHERLGRDPIPSAIREDVRHSTANDIGPLLPHAEDVFAQAPSLRRARLIPSVLHDSHILWIDDNPAWVRYESELFDAFGINTTITTNTEDAIQSIRNRVPDLVISDMARNDNQAAGLESLQLLNAEFPRLPVLFYIGYVDPTRGVPKGAWSISDNPEELFHSVMDVLERYRV